MQGLQDWEEKNTWSTSPIIRNKPSFSISDCIIFAILTFVLSFPCFKAHAMPGEDSSLSGTSHVQMETHTFTVTTDQLACNGLNEEVSQLVPPSPLNGLSRPWDSAWPPNKFPVQQLPESIMQTTSSLRATWMGASFPHISSIVETKIIASHWLLNRQPQFTSKAERLYLIALETQKAKLFSLFSLILFLQFAGQMTFCAILVHLTVCS